jgi:hypothetical protein
MVCGDCHRCAQTSAGEAGRRGRSPACAWCTASIPLGIAVKQSPLPAVPDNRLGVVAERLFTVTFSGYDLTR